MPGPRRLISALLLTFLACVALPAAAQDAPLTDADIEQAIEKIKAFLFEAQHESGAWYGSHHTGPGDVASSRNAWGPTALATLALIESGESPQREEIRKALRILEINPIEGTYALSMRAHVWAALPDRFRALLHQDTQVMLKSLCPAPDNAANFNYFVSDAAGFRDQRTRIDNSTTQFGVLAIWEARKRGLNVPMGFWQAVAEGFLTMQQRDGGWSYTGAANTTQSMTVAGATCMLIAQQELFRRDNRPNEKIKTGIDNGLFYLDRNYNLREMDNHGGASYCYMGYARIMQLTGRRYFGEHDAYEEIARKIIERNARHLGSIHTAAFDLMFLVRGRAPIWIIKLEVPSVAWNNRPNDIYFLNQFMNEQAERVLNWQVVNIDTMLTGDWADVPLTWFSADGAFQLTDRQSRMLNRYLEAGGTLIFNPERRDPAFFASVQALAAGMYPDLEFERIPIDHPMVNAIIGPERPERNVPFRVLRGGGRVLMILPDEDWGMKFQAEDEPQPDRRGQEHWRFITNIFAVTTNHGQWLEPRLPAPEEAE